MSMYVIEIVSIITLNQNAVMSKFQANRIVAESIANHIKENQCISVIWLYFKKNRRKGFT